MKPLRLVLVLVLVLVLGLGRLSEGAGFDHTAHASAVPSALACARCHAGPTGLGHPTHATCFTDCHGGGAGGKLDVSTRAPVCQVCHADATLAKPPALFAIGRDLAPSLGHASHAAIACAQCHAATSTPAKPHARCASCHSGDGAAGHGPAMTACATCHAAGRAPARLVASELPLAFSHPRHAARSAAGKACATCHANVASALAGGDLPRVPLAACTTCHDGATAFAPSATCTRCHDAAPRDAWSPPKPGPRFSHATHGKAALACASCHVLAASGEPMVAHHDACAGCHAMHPPERAPSEDDPPPICGACHEGTEPWRHLVADRAPPDATELGASLDHGAHATAACTTCHARRTPTSELRMPHGHVACSGAGCHAIGEGPAPTLATCDGCHRLGVAAERIATRMSAAWNVRTTFDHARHAGREPIACATCHTALAGAQLLATPTPAKATCAPCHDGKTAFKLTGTSCRRCHSRA